MKPPLQYEKSVSGLELRRVPVELGDERLDVGVLVHRTLQHVVGDLAVLVVLVEVVADAGPVREQVLDGDAIVDERKVRAEDRAGGRVEAEHTVLDEAHHCERGEALGRRWRGRTACRGCSGTSYARFGEAVGLGQHGLAATVDPHHAGEGGRRGDLVDGCFEIGHARSVTSVALQHLHVFVTASVVRRGARDGSLITVDRGGLMRRRVGGLVVVALLALVGTACLPLSTAGDTTGIQFVSTTNQNGWKYDYYRDVRVPVQRQRLPDVRDRHEDRLVADGAGAAVDDDARRRRGLLQRRGAARSRARVRRSKRPPPR